MTIVIYQMSFDNHSHDGPPNVYWLPIFSDQPAFSCAHIGPLSFTPRNFTPQQMLQGVIKSGAQVEVCALYLPNTGRKASDLIEGVTPAKPAEVAAFFLKPGVRTLSF